jgi:hypothetical protein
MGRRLAWRRLPNLKLCRTGVNHALTGRGIQSYGRVCVAHRGERCVDGLKRADLGEHPEILRRH